MKVLVLPDAEAAARRAAALVAAEARQAAAERGLFALALSGGSTPARMLRLLAGEDVPWAKVHLFQADERVAPSGSAERNFTGLAEELLLRVPLEPGRVHPMPVEEPDLEAAAARYAEELARVAGRPPVLDLVHLGLGADGHAASLVPGDPALDAAAEVSATGPYQGRRRMTLGLPALDRARRILWLVTGSAKAGALERLRRGDPSIPAGRVRRERALVVADREAAAAGEG